MRVRQNWHFAILVFSAFCGLLTGVELGLYIAAGIAVLFSLFVLVVLREKGYLTDGGVLLVILLVTALPVTYLTTFVSRQFSSIADLWVMAAAFSAIPHFKQAIRSLPVMRVLVVLYFAYLLVAVASSLVGDVHIKAAVYQLLYNLKLPAMLLAGLSINWTPYRTAVLRWVLLLAIALIFIGVAFEVIAPGLYRSLAVGSLAKSVTPNPIMRGLLPSVSGPFIHSGMLAVSASFVGSILLLFYLTGSGHPKKEMYGFLLATVLVVLSGQQQETLAYLLTLVVVLVLAKTRPSWRVIIWAFAGVGVLVFGLLSVLGDNQLAKLESQWGVTASTQRLDSARPVFTRDGVELANTAFPFGTGLGTFGSVGAQTFDRGLYTKLGYDTYWWYRQNIFLLDTYWPNIVAESGWLGGGVLFCFLLFALLSVIWFFWKEEDLERKRLFGIASAGHLIVLATSLTSPIYSNPSSCAWLLVWTGMCIKYTPEYIRSLKATPKRYYAYRVFGGAQFVRRGGNNASL